MPLWEYGIWITVTCFLDVRWHRSSLSPAYSHMPKDYYSITTALLRYRENMQTSGKHTFSIKLLAVKEINTCWALDWEYEHIVNVLSQSINNNKLLKLQWTFSGTLIVCFHLISLPPPSLSFSLSLFLFLSLSFSLSLSSSWTTE